MSEERKQRRDAVANRARIVAAATEVLRTEGMGADMRRIAAASGVGIGTLYRHFPTRDDLVQAVTGTDLTALADAGLPAELSAIEALREFFTATITQLSGNKAMLDLLTSGSPTDEDLERCLTHLTGVGQDAVDRARDDHTLAADVTADDIAYQLLGLIRIAQLRQGTEAGGVTRHVNLALRGLGATGSATEPSSAVAGHRTLPHPSRPSGTS